MPSTSSPSSFKDFYCDTFDEAFAEVRRRKSAAEQIITRLDESPYGGYRVYSIPLDLFVDDLVEPSQPSIPGGGFTTRKAVYQ